MLPLKQLVGRAVTLSRKQPMLWIPPVGVALLSTLTLPAGKGPVALMVVVSALIGLAVTVGWYALIVRADAEGTPTWDEFFVAIGRFFSSLVIGTLAYGTVIGLVGLPLLLLGASWIGSDKLLQLQTQLQTKLLPALEKAQSQPEVLASIEPWMWTTLNQVVLVVAAITVWYGIVSVALLFWKQAMVVSELGWRMAWMRSIQVLKEHFRIVMGMLTLQAIAYLFAALLGAMPAPFGIIGWFCLIGVHVISTMTYTIFYVRAYPPLKTPGAESVAPNSPMS